MIESYADLFPGLIVRDIAAERERQEALRRSGKFPATTATIGGDQMTAHECYAVLGEEVGEVARALNDGAGPEHLREELIQAAAVIVGWVSRLDGGGVK